MAEELFGSNKLIVYDAAYCLKYMKYIILNTELNASQIREIQVDSKILSATGPGFSHILQKWIVKAISFEIESLESKIKVSRVNTN